MTISRNATAKSSTFSEKNDMHITAPKNAATASTAPIPQRRFRFLGLLNSLTPLSLLPYSIPKGRNWLQILCRDAIVSF